MTRVVAQPGDYRAGLGRGRTRPGCQRRLGRGPPDRPGAGHLRDPQCEADHGFTGALVGDDLTVRMSAAADGADRVARLVALRRRALQRAAAV